MTTKPKPRPTPLQVSQARLGVALDALASIGAMRPRTQAVRYAASAHAFLVYCCGDKKPNAKLTDAPR